MPDSEIDAIVQSALFDRNWYCEHVLRKRVRLRRAVAHYVRVGAKAGAAPHPLFDGAW
jgi:hypothetical protein